jgi:hypothetical protein
VLGGRDLGLVPAAGLLIPAVAAVMNLLAAGASFGALVAVFQYGRLDAFILRTIADPALMHLSAQANWWLPGWPDRILPICPSNPPPGHPHGPAQRRHLPGPAPARSGLEV